MVNFLPKTVLGKWSVALMVIFFLLVAVFHFCLRSSDAEKLIALSITVVAAVGAFVTGIVGVVKSKEGAFPVLLSTVTGFIVLMFVLPSIVGSVVGYIERPTPHPTGKASIRGSMEVRIGISA